MRIIPNHGAPEIPGAPTQAARQPVRLEQDNVSLSSADTLTQALGQTPEVRADKVARARELVLDASYPPQVLIRKLSALLAVHLDPKSSEDTQDATAGQDAAQ